MALGDLVWQRNALIDNSGGASHEELLIASVAATERLERVQLSFYVNTITTDSDVILTWLAQGVLVTVQWTQASFGTPGTPEQVGTSDLSLDDILVDSYARLGPAEIFTDLRASPDRGVVHLDAVVRRTPPSGGSGRVWCCWGLADFSGAGVAVGFRKVYSRVLVSTIA